MWKLILWEHLHFSWNSIGKGILWILRWFIRVLVILLCFLPFFILSLSSVALPFTLEANPPASPAFVSALLLSVLLLSTGMIAWFIRENPLRIPRMLYLLPVSYKERLKYLYLRFFMRLFWLLAVMILFHYFTLNMFFYETTPLCIAVQLVICLFTIWSLLLKTGLYGFLSGSSLEESVSVKEKIVNFYWGLFLILQQLLLGISFIVRLYDRFPALWLIWGLIHFVNIAAAKYATRSYLERALSYEQVYVKKE